MARKGKHINIHIFNVYFNVSYGLYGVGMEINALFSCQSANLFYGHYSSYLVIGEHNRY